MHIDPTSTPIRNPAVLSRRVFENEMILVNGDTAVSLALTNPTAVAVWELTDGHNSVQDIVDRVANSFKNVPESVSRDILELLELLTEDGFIGFELDPEEQGTRP
ncbi:MAG: hypothetical protein Kow0089_17280 [Desulfobulbaceae bacterium]